MTESRALGRHGEDPPAARPETSSGTQIEKIVAGEYLAGVNISAAPTYPVVKDSGGLLKVVFADDGTVVMPRGIGITPKAPHANTAKLFLDFVLSHEGQAAVAEGGLTSYRDDVKAVEGLHTYQEVVDAVGQDNVIMTKYDLIPDDEVKAFTDKWNGLIGADRLERLAGGESSSPASRAPTPTDPTPARADRSTTWRS